MKPQTIGRALGIGLRVAGRIAGQRIAASTQNATTAPAVQAGDSAGVRVVAGGRAAGLVTGGVARGVGGFLRPFRRVGGILWLEVTGGFFFLFVVAAGLAMWRARPGNLHGPYDKNFLAAAGILVVFLYLGVSSFWRARKR